MDIILIAGLWLDASIWDRTAALLRDQGHRPVPLSLPGVADRATDATLADQIAVAVAAVDQADRPVVVGHSAAATLAWILADRRPEAVRRVVMVGGFPASPESAYADFFPIVDGVMPFPGWDPFEGPDADDLDPATRTRLAAAAVPVPAGVAQGTVTYTNERRYAVPVTLVCPEFSPQQAQAWINEGHLPELAATREISYVDLASGHWPMVSQPAELARVLAAAAHGG